MSDREDARTHHTAAIKLPSCSAASSKSLLCRLNLPSLCGVLGPGADEEAVSGLCKSRLGKGRVYPVLSTATSYPGCTRGNISLQQNS